MSAQTGLQVQGLARHFGGVWAVDGVSFSVQPGQCVALIGPNGAGKSTCFACIAGQQPVTAGRVSWQDQPLLGKSPRQRLALGVARTFQVAQVFDALTTLQNVQLAVQARAGQLSALRRLDAQSVEEAQALLAQVDLSALSDQSAQSLPYGARKRLELALALAAQPQLLLLDEPAAGLAEQERASLMKLVKSLADRGMAVLYTEHNMDAVAGVADHVLVLMEGQLVAQGSFDAISADPVVQQRYLGRPGHPKGAGHA